MKFKNILLISFLMSLNLYAYEPPKNANRAEINCMFISKKLQSQWTKDDWEQCKIDSKDTMPHKPEVGSSSLPRDTIDVLLIDTLTALFAVSLSLKFPKSMVQLL